MRTITPPPPRTCLDVGCGGNGEYDFYPRCRIDSGHIILLDISYPCEKVRRFVKSLPHVSFIVTPEPTAGSKIPKILRIPIILIFYTFSEEIRLRAVAEK